MPRIRRFHPISHMLNRDPEFNTLRDRYADWMGYVWLEMLAWADHTEGELKGEPAAIALTLAPVSRSKRPQSAAKVILKSFTYMEECGWIVVEKDRILIANYKKYHYSREDDKIPVGKNKPPPLTNLTNKPNYKEITTNVVISPSCENHSSATLTDWPLTDFWLKDFLDYQTLLPCPPHTFDDPCWWEHVSYTTNGLSLEMVQREFARMGAWLLEKPRRRPSKPSGWKRFVRGWLERAHEYERRFPYGDQAARRAG